MLRSELSLTSIAHSKSTEVTRVKSMDASSLKAIAENALTSLSRSKNTEVTRAKSMDPSSLEAIAELSLTSISRSKSNEVTRTKSMDSLSLKAIAMSINLPIPDEFICPLSKEVMTHPLMTRSGLNFERTAIVGWLQLGDGTCPVNGTPLEPSDLITNRALEDKIAHWRWENMLPEPSSGRAASSSFASMSNIPDCNSQVIGIVSPRKKKVESKFLKQFAFSSSRTNDASMSPKSSAAHI